MGSGADLQQNTSVPPQEGFVWALLAQPGALGAVPGPCMGPQELSGTAMAPATRLVPAPPHIPPCCWGGEEQESHLLWFEGHLCAPAGEELSARRDEGCCFPGPHTAARTLAGLGDRGVAAIQGSSAN